jgi:adrenodoxin-NADP+ reductase
LKSIPSAKISLVESRYSPFGLIRFGVAPDHPEVKNCIHKFSKILQQENVRFFGGLKAGYDVSLNMLKETNDVMVFCTGMEDARQLKIPGIQFENVLSSHQFVGWYNNDPSIVSRKFDLSKVNDALIIGNGNVALDVARILLKSPDELKLTDISKNALHSLQHSSIKNLRICARRGLEQVLILLTQIFYFEDVIFRKRIEGATRFECSRQNKFKKWPRHIVK